MKLSSSARESLEQATRVYEMFQPLASTYLEGRGLNAQVAGTFRLGVVEEPEVGHEMYRDRLSIPYLTKAGVVYIKFRCIEEHNCSDFKDSGHKKYLNTTTPTRIYNTQAFFRDEPFIAITEGEIDAMVLHELVGIPAVAVPGVKNWKRHYERCFTDYDRVFVFADGDEPGKDLARFLSSTLDEVRVIQMPDGEDVNSVFLAEGPDALRKRAGL